MTKAVTDGARDTRPDGVVWNQAVADRAIEIVRKPLFSTSVLYLVFVLTQLAHREMEFGLSKSFNTLVDNYYAPPAVDPCAPSNARLLTESASPRSLLTGGGVTSSSSYVGKAGKTRDAVKTLGDVMDWIEVSLLRWLWQVGPDGKGVVMTFSSVFGGVRIKQKRMGTVDCPGADDMVQKFSSTPCFGGAEEAGTSFAVPADSEPSRFELHEDGFYSYWLDISLDECNATAHTSLLRSAQWLQPGVDTVIIQTIFYNAQVAFFMVLEVTFRIAVDGSVVPKIIQKALPTQIYTGAFLIMGDIVFEMLLVAFAISESMTLVQAIQDEELKEYLRWSSVLNWSIVWIGVGFSIFFIYLFFALTDVAGQAAAVSAVSDQESEYWLKEASAAWEVRHQGLDDCYDEILRLADLLRTCELWTFWYSLIIMVKFFEGFQSHPRLNVVMATLRCALVDVAHFLIIFCLVLFNFTLGAMFLFGNFMYEWSNLSLALNTAFRALMGDFDFGSMYAVAPVSAMIWFWLFMWGFYMILLNMLLGIVMDSYASVQEKLKEEKEENDRIEGGRSLGDVDEEPGKEPDHGEDGEGPRGAGQAGWGTRAEENLQDGGGLMEKQNIDRISSLMLTVHNVLHEMVATSPGFQVARNRDASPKHLLQRHIDAKLQAACQSGDEDDVETIKKRQQVPPEYVSSWGQAEGKESYTRPKLMDRYMYKSPRDYVA